MIILIVLHLSYILNNHFLFFFNDTATTEIYTLSLLDALPIWTFPSCRDSRWPAPGSPRARAARDRKSTRLNSSHSSISYAVFCLKKKKTYAVVPNTIRAISTSATSISRSFSISLYFHRDDQVPISQHDIHQRLLLLFFFFNDTATTEIYTLSLHDALPI